MNNSISGYFKGRENDIPEVVDLRNLEAPGPLQWILENCTGMPESEQILVHLPHIPNPLFPHLLNRGMQWQIFEQDDGSAQLLIWKSS